MVFSYRITLHLFYVHNENSFESIDEPDSSEPGLSSEEVDIFMNGNISYFTEPRYVYYARTISYSLICGNNPQIADEEPFDIEYEDGGILKFTIELPYEKPIVKIKNSILMNSFEDTMIEGEIGNECIVRSREKHPIKIELNLNSIPIHCMDYYKLGHIDCRANDSIFVEKI